MYHVSPVIQTLFCIFLAIAQCFTSVFYLSRSLSYPKQKKRMMTTLLLVLFMMIYGAARVLYYEQVRFTDLKIISFTFPLAFLYSFFRFNDKATKKIIVPAFYTVMAVVLSIALEYLKGHLWTDFYPEQRNSIVHYFITMILPTQFFITALFTGQHFFEHGMKRLLPDLLFLALGLLCFLSILFISINFSRFIEPLSGILLAICLFNFVIFLIVIPFYNILISTINELRDTEQLKIVQQLRLKHYEDVHKEYIALQKLKHDYKNNLVTVISLLNKGQVKEGEEYLKSMAEIITGNDVVSTGRPETDALISAKLQEMKTCDIRLHLSLCELTDIPMPSFELNSILMNLLDNAKEALLKEQLTDPYISLQVNRVRDTLVISCSNPYTEIDQRVEEGFPDSSKKEEGHGYGLKIIQRITDEYNGVFNIFLRDNVFHAVVTFPYHLSK